MTTNTMIDLNDKMKIPSLGFGTWKIPNTEAPGIIDNALAMGYRLIDTAAVYENEAGVGAGIRESGMAREEIFLTTKVWNTDQGYDSTLRAFEKSLNKLKTDYLDLYLIHWPRVNSETYIPTWKAMQRLRKEGLVKSIGVSNFTTAQIERLINETGIIPTVNQIELHPYFQQKELREFHAKYKIQTEAWSPLARGELFSDEVIVTISHKHQKTPAQIVLRWHLQNELIAIPKSANPKRMLENLNVFDFQLDDLDMEKLNGLDRKDGRTGPDPLTAAF